MVTGYFLLPLDRLGPDQPGLSWTLFLLALTCIAVLILRQIRDVVLDLPDPRSGLVIAVLMAESVLVFAAAYYALAHEPGQLIGLSTRVDALYFTLVSVATVGYGDIAPLGQTARLVAIVQILYSVVFLTAAATALSRRVRVHAEEKTRKEHPERKERGG
ncbi:two pore domain potassium channel family protein [Streptomyces sp. YC537]|uniref:Two pore domain potassium channel family protein n=1 Tax=Streptomyces boluensis TaxID=1775135 RepID=A0A964XNV7_9ACTN|nr:two pore domain potassium channel family protein [Streptomyces boluensis]